jgi:uncharacterized protein HemY
MEINERKIVEELPKKKKAKAKVEDTYADDVVETKDDNAAEHKHKEETKKEEPSGKPISKAKPTFVEEKRTEKAKSEEKKIKSQPNFMKNIRGIFRKRGDR